jgi:phage-related minor tail protein
LGNWRNYEELEENLSMPELIQTLKSFKKQKSEDRKFAAGLKGIELNIDEDEEEVPEGKTFEDIQRKALGINASSDDILSLQGTLAASAGFGIGAGLGYSKE